MNDDKNKLKKNHKFELKERSKPYTRTLLFFGESMRNNMIKTLFFFRPAQIILIPYKQVICMVIILNLEMTVQSMIYSSDAGYLLYSSTIFLIFFLIFSCDPDFFYLNLCHNSCETFSSLSVSSVEAN